MRRLIVEGGAGVVSFGLAIVLLIAAVMLVFGPGWLLLPWLIRLLRWWAGLARQRAGLAFEYPALPDGTPNFAELRALLVAPSTRRDLAWLLAHAITAPVAALLAVTLPVGALNSLLVPAYWWALPSGLVVSNLYPVTSWWGAAGMPLLAIAYAGLWWWATPRMAVGVEGLARKLLRPTRESALTARVSALTQSRAAALDAHGAELRRIERDLHDGAQNRLVGVVMMLGLAERALETTPDQALPHVLRARDAAMEALAGLRSSVHDIYPPILDELGLDGAAAVLAGRSVVPCELDTASLGRAPAAVESAAYFVVAEALTNVAKHSGAAAVRLRLAGGVDGLRIEITDDGRGGAAVRTGGGLAGIRRRAEAFEGVMALSSPVGGPTTIEVELPCGL